MGKPTPKNNEFGGFNMKKILTFALLLTMLLALAATASAKAPGSVEAEGVAVSAKVEQLTGNQNKLWIIIEDASGITEQDFMIRNNAEGVYPISTKYGDYNVYVNTKGNTQIRDCYIVSFTPVAILLYQGHGSLRITTLEGKVIYIDPYAGGGYDAPADLILITHPHNDHTAVHLIETKNPDCITISHVEALVDGVHKTFDLGFVTVEAVQAGNNPNHNINVCVGYILTFNDGITVYVAGDTSKTEQMATFATRNLDYAFFPCDGRFNMGIPEAIECALLVGAKHSIPYHIEPGLNFNRERAELFEVKNRLILADGEEISLR